MHDSRMNFKTNIPTLIYILRMTGFVHHVFINKKNQKCENIKLRKLKNSGVQGLCKLQIPERRKILKNPEK
jgi:hypothetical protein